MDGQLISMDTSQPNPNNVEFDNLYLDMNGIIHPCCHPEDKPAPKTEDEMFLEIFKYIDRIFAMIRPRKLLYMAIDGVAPRAKMNQQRSRRFRAAREEALKKEEEEKTRKEWEANGQKWPESMKNKTHFDSNCITPGTPFMARLAECLRYYIAQRLNSDPGWKKISVILSDASVPGEGEHKIMDYIRRQRNLPDYNPNTHHVLYGLDADLIMLALATHEPHFKILREDVFFQNGRDKACAICGQTGHMASVCRGEKKEKVGEFDEKTVATPLKPFVFLHVSVLREYLEIELKVLDLPFRWSLERALDDWVFMCFFVGNDFLPHLPSLEIREGAIDTLIKLWKENIGKWGGFLTDSGDIDLERVEKMMACLGELEDDVFKNRREIEERKRAARIRRKKEARLREARTDQKEPVADDVPEIVQSASQAQLQHAYSKPRGGSSEANKSAAASLKASLLEECSVKVEQGTKRKVPPPEEEEEILEEAHVTPVAQSKVPPEDTLQELDVEEEDAPDEVDVPLPQVPVVKDEDEEVEPEDNIRLWESGWKERYYEKKFHVDLDNHPFRKSLVTSYVEGLCWVLKYYYQGVQSWKWFYPYHYSPFSSDFGNISNLKIQFELGIPFRPIEQLMAVLPAASKDHIPKPFHDLMEKESSPIIDFYPIDFPIDLNGKMYAWQGVALLPFIEEERLLAAIQPIYSLITEEETIRNSLGYEVIYISHSSSVFEAFCAIYSKRGQTEPYPLTKQIGASIYGSILPDEQVCLPGSTFSSPLSEWDQPDIYDNQSISVHYLMPKYKTGYTFKAQLLYGVTFEPPVLSDYDKYLIKNGSTTRGMRRQEPRQYDNKEAAGRFIKHGISVNAAAYGYDQRRPSRDETSPQKRQAYDSRRSESFHYKREEEHQYGYRREENRYSSGRQQRSGGYRPDSHYYSRQSHEPSPYASHSSGTSSSFLNSLMTDAPSSHQASTLPQNYLAHLPGGGRYSQGGQQQQQQGYYPTRYNQQNYQGMNVYQNQQQSFVSQNQRPPQNLGWSRNLSRSQQEQQRHYRPPRRN